jgi:hypothetical protein
MLTDKQVEHIGGGPVLAWREDEQGNLTLINAIGQKVRFTGQECAALLPPGQAPGEAKPVTKKKPAPTKEGSSRTAPTN